MRRAPITPDGRCSIHGRKLTCPACIGAKGGLAKSARKVRASRRNGRLFAKS
jgi:hypothetical protein